MAPGVPRVSAWTRDSRLAGFRDVRYLFGTRVMLGRSLRPSHAEPAGLTGNVPGGPEAESG